MKGVRQRDEKDARISHIWLTEQGRRQFQQHSQTRLPYQDALLQCLTPQETKELNFTTEAEGVIHNMSFDSWYKPDGSNAWYETFVFPTQAASIAYIESILGPMSSKTSSLVGEGAAGYATVGESA